ncbi:MAG: hypothetical protein ACYDAI_10430 [Trichloromonadaceae bacterium]
MFETCMLLAFLCAGLCQLLPPPPPPPARDFNSSMESQPQPFGAKRPPGTLRTTASGAYSPFGADVPASRRLQ